MAERPILFSGPMVRAILAGEKTVTRRLVTPQPYRTEDLTAFVMPGVSVRQPAGWNWKRTGLFVADSEVGAFAHYLGNSGRAYAQPGDTLWVRETWGAWPHMGGGIQPDSLRYRATDEPPPDPHAAWRWRPSIFMPREACRLRLRIVSVRAERLHEITPADVFREGVGLRRLDLDAPIECAAAIGTFRDLWDAINGKRAPWASDPWVWRIAFEVLGHG